MDQVISSLQSYLDFLHQEEQAMAFMGHYYRTLDVNLAALGNFYDGGSMLTFEGQKIQGSQNIMAKLTSLPFQQCQHNIATVDCRPSAGGGMFVSVSGILKIAGML